MPVISEGMQISERASLSQYAQDAVIDLTNEQYTSVNALGVGDVDNDGDDDIIANYDWYIDPGGTPKTVVLSWNGSKYVVSGEIPNFSMLLQPGFMVQGVFHIVVGDADNDGLNELLMPGKLNGVQGIYMYERQGSSYVKIWQAVGTYLDGEICDIDSDGLNEVIVPSLGVMVWLGGNLVKEKDLEAAEGVRIGDMNGDGVTEIIITSGGSYSLGIKSYQYSGNSLELLGAAELTGDRSCGFGVADLDGDSKDEAFRLDYHNKMVVWGHDGIEMISEWTGMTPEDDNPTTGFACDADDDGIGEAFVGNGNYALGDTVLQYELDGAGYTNTWDSGPLSMYCHSIACGDTDDDGSSELVVGTGSQGHVYVYSCYALFTDMLMASMELSSTNVTEAGTVEVALSVKSSTEMVSDATVTLSDGGAGGWFSAVANHGAGNYSATYTAPLMYNITKITLTAAVLGAGYLGANATCAVMLVPTTDPLPPVVEITYPGDGDVVNAFQLAVSGTASDNWEVSTVHVRVGDSSWILCSGTDSWNAWVTLSVGDNTIEARCIDTSGNEATASVTAHLTLPDGEWFGDIATFDGEPRRVCPESLHWYGPNYCSYDVSVDDDGLFWLAADVGLGIRVFVSDDLVGWNETYLYSGAVVPRDIQMLVVPDGLHWLLWSEWKGYDQNGTIFTIRGSKSEDGRDWSAPFDVMGDGSDFHMMRDNDGKYWMAYLSAHNHIYVVSTEDFVHWSSPVEVMPNDYSWRSHLYLMEDAAGWKWLTWSMAPYFGTGESSLQYSKSLSGTQWTAAKTSLNLTGAETAPIMAQDSRGVFWLAFEKQDADGTGIFFATSPDGSSWTNVSRIADAGASDDCVPRSVADQYSRVIVFFGSDREYSWDDELGLFRVWLVAGDLDGDGFADDEDDFPLDPAASEDYDGDGHPDAWNTGMSEANSTTNLTLDEFPYEPTQWSDSDGDGYGDNPDGIRPDTFPEDPLEWTDTNHDGVGDNADTDDDGDGMPDEWELKYGLDPKRWDDASRDSDDDGFSNVQEFNAGTNPLDRNSYPIDPIVLTTIMVMAVVAVMAVAAIWYVHRK